MERKILLSEIHKISNLILVGDDFEVNGLNLCNRNTVYPSILSYAASENYLLKAIENPSVKALVLTHELFEICAERSGGRISFLISNNPERDFYLIHNHLYQSTDFYNKNNFPKIIGLNPNIHPTAIVEDGAAIGDNVIIGAYSIIKNGTVIGDNVSIGCNSTIGGEGFQAVYFNGVPNLIPHTGGCRISDGVMILNNVAVSKSLFEGATFIGENVKINSLVSIDHNCVVEKNSVLTAGVKLCGSSYIRQGAWLGTNSTVLNNVIVGETALLGIGCVAIRDIPDGAVAVGNPSRIIREKGGNP